MRRIIFTCLLLGACASPDPDTGHADLGGDADVGSDQSTLDLSVGADLSSPDVTSDGPGSRPACDTLVDGLACTQNGCAFDGTVCAEWDAFDSMVGTVIDWPVPGTAYVDGQEVEIIRATVTSIGGSRGSIWFDLDGERHVFPISMELSFGTLTAELLPPKCDGTCDPRFDAPRYSFDGKYIEDRWVFNEPTPIGNCTECLSPFWGAHFQPNDGFRPSGGPSGLYRGQFLSVPSDFDLISNNEMCTVEIPALDTLANFTCGNTAYLNVVPGVDASSFADDLNRVWFQLDDGTTNYVVVGTAVLDGLSLIVARDDGSYWNSGGQPIEVADVAPEDIVGMLFLPAVDP